MLAELHSQSTCTMAIVHFPGAHYIGARVHCVWSTQARVHGTNSRDETFGDAGNGRLLIATRPARGQRPLLSFVAALNRVHVVAINIVFVWRVSTAGILDFRLDGW